MSPIIEIDGAYIDMREICMIGTAIDGIYPVHFKSGLEIKVSYADIEKDELAEKWMLLQCHY